MISLVIGFYSIPIWNKEPQNPHERSMFSEFTYPSVRAITNHYLRPTIGQYTLHSTCPDQTGQVIPTLIGQYCSLRNKELRRRHCIVKRIVLRIHRQTECCR